MSKTLLGFYAAMNPVILSSHFGVQDQLLVAKFCIKKGTIWKICNVIVVLPVKGNFSMKLPHRNWPCVIHIPRMVL